MSPRNTYSEKIRRIEQGIRAGRTSSVREEFLALAGKRHSARERLQLAGLSFRLGVPVVGLRILHAVVRPTGARAKPASPAEIAVYAQCLNSCGGSEEALQLLDRISPAAWPQANLFRAFALVTQWRYSEAIAPLAAYLELRSLTSYQRQVALLNLASALNFVGQEKKARPLLRQLLYETSVRRLPLLHLNALKFAAQNHVAMGEWDAAERFLVRAEKEMTDPVLVDSFFIFKWRSIIRFLRDSDAPALRKLRENASHRGHWETVRECDRYEAVAHGDRAVLMRVYMGTPFPAYRKALEESVTWAIPAPESFDWVLQGKGGEPALDLVEGIAVKTGNQLPALLHRALLVLSRDFYAPVRGFSLGFHTYSEEAFNPDTTPKKVHEAIRRVRGWLLENGIPIGVEELNGSYRLRAGAPVTVRLPGHSNPGNAALTVGDRLQALWPAEPFSLPDASQKLNTHLRTLQREVDRLVSAGTLVRTGKARATRYCFARATARKVG